MRDKYNPPVSMQLYFGVGEEWIKVREALLAYSEKMGVSVSKILLQALKEKTPSIFRGIPNVKK